MTAMAARLVVRAGFLLGVSFAATPAKSMAPNLPMVRALDDLRVAWISAAGTVAIRRLDARP